jgi:flagellar basal-body rod modification protein FlgD
MSITTTSAADNGYAGLGLQTQGPVRDSSLGQADFLRLMTEQLKNQDPLKPLDNAQFLGQLAQFSTVQGIEKMQGAMGAVASVMESDQALRAAALVGHDALIEASTLDLAADTPVNGEVIAPAAGPITVEIVDGNGTTVRTMTVQATGAGLTPFHWDGRDDSGDVAGAGRYTIRATSGGGDNVQQLDVAVEANVESVSIGAEGLILNLAGLGSHPLSSIRRIG